MDTRQDATTALILLEYIIAYSSMVNKWKIIP
nr:MAG TPA: hypothetical protein [Caudoviricetes sp.]